MYILIKHLYIYIIIFTFKSLEVLFKSTLSDYFGYIGEIVAVMVKSVIVVGLDLLDGFNFGHSEILVTWDIDILFGGGYFLDFVEIFFMNFFISSIRSPWYILRKSILIIITPIFLRSHRTFLPINQNNRSLFPIVLL